MCMGYESLRIIMILFFPLSAAHFLEQKVMHTGSILYLYSMNSHYVVSLPKDPVLFRAELYFLLLILDCETCSYF